MCGFVAKSKAVLERHKRKVHKLIQYPCNQCNYVACFSNTLKRHVDAVHKGKRYYCDKCKFSAQEKWKMKKHVKTKHSISDGESGYTSKERLMLKNQFSPEGAFAAVDDVLKKGK